MNKYRNGLMVAILVMAVVTGTGVLLWGDADLEVNRQAAAASQRDRGGSVWGANYFPNIPLITHDGETVHFFDDLIKDKVVAVNFIYTSCPDACPMETARMKEVQRLLGDRVGEDVFFYSITIDPENDTPEVLHDYVENWQIGPGWTFLTGKEEDIILLRKKLGIYIEEIQEEDGSLDHNLSLVIGNQSTGRWMKRSPYENPYILATQLGSWLHNWKLPSKEKRDYAQAPELRQIATGELLFRTRCASCHTIGGGDIREPAERRVGPDLYDITAQRDPQWLERWLIEPDKMLEEKDPLAVSLYAQYNNVPMPNLRLSRTDVDHLLDYIEEESRAFDRRREAGRMASQRAEHSDHAGHEGHHMEHGGAGHGEDAAQAGDHDDHGEHGDHPASHR